MELREQGLPEGVGGKLAGRAIFDLRTERKIQYHNYSFDRQIVKGWITRRAPTNRHAIDPVKIPRFQ
jgi:hypothetical protein